MAGLRFSSLALALALAAGATLAHAQFIPRQRDPGGMSFEERQRLREELQDARRDVYEPREERELRERRRQERMRRAGEASRLTPEEREKLRRDIQDANRDLERRR